MIRDALLRVSDPIPSLSVVCFQCIISDSIEVRCGVSACLVSASDRVRFGGLRSKSFSLAGCHREPWPFVGSHRVEPQAVGAGSWLPQGALQPRRALPPLVSCRSNQTKILCTIGHLEKPCSHLFKRSKVAPLISGPVP